MLNEKFVVLKDKIKLLIASLALVIIVPAQAGLIDFGHQGSVNLGTASNYTFAAAASEFGERGSFNVGAAELQGNFLSSSRSYQLGDGATLDGTRFLTTDSLKGNVQRVVGLTEAFKVEVPELSSLAIFALAMIGLLSSRFKQYS